ncbi:MAG TPA: hypothetical protein VJ808_10280 [Gemmatimonadales bacterium]|nr:hypothetical protein [Gemmatimonadales bacterium]
MNTPPFPTLALAAMACLLAAPAAAQGPSPDARSKTVYVAQLHPMNVQATGLQTSGEARFTVQGDELTISVKVRGAAPGIVHWQHFHGFKDGRNATCAPASADINRDGIIDLIETEPASGTTMVPFIEDPVSMNVAEGVYPKASAAGTYEYRSTVSLEALRAAFSKAFDGSKLDLERRVVLIHGTAKQLPASVASLGPIPAKVTLPIACGIIERGS